MKYLRKGRYHQASIVSLLGESRFSKGQAVTARTNDVADALFSSFVHRREDRLRNVVNGNLQILRLTCNIFVLWAEPNPTHRARAWQRCLNRLVTDFRFRLHYSVRQRSASSLVCVMAGLVPRQVCVRTLDTETDAEV